MIKLILFTVAAYLYGSIPFGYWLALSVRHTNVREKGSGNIGATNITRVLGFKFGLVSLLFDLSKGIIPFLIAEKLFPGQRGVALCCSSASILGHNFSLFLSFKGGKGIGTTAGLLLMFDYRIALVLVCIWILTILTSGWVSLASILALCTAPWLMIWLYPVISEQNLFAWVFVFFYAILGLWQHRENIKRLLSHQEKVMFKHNLLKNR